MVPVTPDAVTAAIAPEAPRYPLLRTFGSRPVLSVAARRKLSRGCRRHIAIALRGSTRHENTRRRDCEATSVAIGPSMRSGSICATWPFDPRAAPSQALPPYKKNCSVLPTCPPSAICRTARASARPAERASIPIDAPASSGSAQSRFLRGRYAAIINMRTLRSRPRRNLQIQRTWTSSRS